MRVGTKQNCKKKKKCAWVTNQLCMGSFSPFGFNKVKCVPD